MLDHPLDHPRITRVISEKGRYFHFIRLNSPADIDDQLRNWLTESYAISSRL